MRIISRVFFVTLLSVTLTVVVARVGAADCLRFVTYDYFIQHIDLKSGYAFPRAPSESIYSLLYTTSPDKSYQGHFRRRILPNGDNIYDFYVVPIDEKGGFTNAPRLLYRDLPEPYTVGGSYLHHIVDSVWLPDSQHILLSWSPDYYRFRFGTGNQNSFIANSTHEFAVIDLMGNTIARHTLTLPTIPPSSASEDFQTLIIEGISADGKIVAIRHYNGTHETIDLLSLTDFQPVAPPIGLYPDGCYIPYESSDQYCAEWSPVGNTLTVIGQQSDGNPMVVIHNFDTAQRHTIPLPTAPYERFLVMPWSSNGNYDVVSWGYARHATQLVFDRDGNHRALLSNAAMFDLSIIPKHFWTPEGNGLLYYEQDDIGQMGKLFLPATQQMIVLPGYHMGDFMFQDHLLRGTQLALVWSESQGEKKWAKIGVLDTTTGTLSTLYTFDDQWLGPDDGVSVYWLSDTRLAASMPFGFVWGNTDGSDWQIITEPVSLYKDTFTADGNSVLVSKQDEGQRNVYALNLLNGEFQPVMTSSDTALTMQLLERSPSERYLYRLIPKPDAYPKTDMEMVDTLTNHSYKLEDAAKPLWWSSDEKQFLYVANIVSGPNWHQELRWYDTETGELLRQFTHVPAHWESQLYSMEYGRCN